MIAHVYKPRRRKNGKLEVSRLYRGRFRLKGDYAITEVPLHTSDKQVAERALAEIISEREREKAGIIAPRLQRESAQTPLLDHLDDFVADLGVLGRCWIYRRQVKLRATRLINGCAWRHPGDITIDSFVAWRSRQTELGPKTLNEYLNAMNALLNWMERQERIAANPLRKVTRVDVRGRQQRRRAFTDDELARLLAVAGRKRPLYLAAAYTGLRAGELQQLVWGDLKLDGERPHILLRAITAKNRRDAVIPLHPELLAELQRLRATSTGIGSGDPVFVGCKQNGRTIRRYMLRAGIRPIDDTGRKLDFHALRYTFATKLAQSGVSQRLAQELLRHSDPRLTANLYTDVTQLPAFDAVSQLTWIKWREGNVGGILAKPDTQLDPQNTDANGFGGSSSAAFSSTSNPTGKPHQQREIHEFAQPAAAGQNTGREGLEGQRVCASERSLAAGYENEFSSNTQLAPQVVGMRCAVLDRLNRFWPRLPRVIRAAIDAMVVSQIRLRLCSTFFGRFFEPSPALASQLRPFAT